MLFIVNETPKLKELQTLITPNYASCWEEIGIGLNLPYGTLQTIERDYTKTEQRCTNMLAKWLQKDNSATWQKLLQVIDLPVVAKMVSPTAKSYSEGKYIVLLCSFLYAYTCASCPHTYRMEDCCPIALRISMN